MDDRPLSLGAATLVDELPLVALLSVTLVAFTLECDNEVELRLAAPGRDSMVSLVGWLNALQYLDDGPCSVGDLCASTFTKPSQVGFVLGCLERWGFVSITLAADAKPRSSPTDGFGSARRVNAKSIVNPTDQGMTVIETWPRVIDMVETRWRSRHGAGLKAAESALSALADVPGVAMPEGVPAGWMQGDWRQFPHGTPADPRHGFHWPVLLGRALLAATISYERRSVIPLALAANTMRVVDEDGTPVSDLHALTGLPSEATGAQCTELSRRGLGTLVKNPAGRGKVLRLTPAGRAAQRAHPGLATDAGAALGPVGADATKAMRTLLTHTTDGELSLRAALVPPDEVRRSGSVNVALEREHPSVQTRNRELLDQTDAFVADPLRALPHYPVWQGTRNFGP